MANRQSTKEEGVISNLVKKVAEVASLAGAGSVVRSEGKTIEGKVEGVIEAAVVGWAWDSSRPYEPLDVEVYSGNTKVGEGKADKFDLNLARAKIGNGMHRFEVRLDRLPGAPPPFVLRTVVSGSEVELHPAVTIPTLDAAEQLLSGSEYFGRVTGIVDGMLCGWVVNRRNPHEKPLLTLRDGSEVLLMQPAGEMISTAVEAGVLANAYRFELPLPATLLNGARHLLSVCAGSTHRDLAGSPVVFGPTDVGSFERSLVALSEKMQQIEARIEPLRSGVDLAAFERQLTVGILGRIDMLLNIHRDSIEREMAVMRRQVTRIIRHVPSMDSDVIVPVSDVPRVEDEAIPDASTFDVVERSMPIVSYDLSGKTAAATASGNLNWTGSGSDGGIRIDGGGSVALESSPAAPISLILFGSGASNALGLARMSAAFDGHPLGGRLDIFQSQDWRLTATTIGGPVPEISGRGLSLQFFSEREQPDNKLVLSRIAIFAPNHAPDIAEAEPPAASIVYLGTQRADSGWHVAEATRRGGICWMGAQSETPFRLRRSRAYRFCIPEVRPLTADIMSKLQISLAGVRASFEISPLRGDPSAFSIEGECSLSDTTAENLTMRITIPGQFVRSPMELGMNNDGRPLTIAARAIALVAQN